MLNLLLIMAFSVACTPNQTEPIEATRPAATAVTPSSLPATATTILATATTLPTATAVPPTTAPTATMLPTATAVPSPTPIPGDPFASWIYAINPVPFYSGPGSEFAPVGMMAVGIAARVLGGMQEDWIPIECPDGVLDSCWVAWDYNSLQPHNGPPSLTLTIPDPASLKIESTDTSVSPNGRWQAEITRSETVSLSGEWGAPSFFVQLKVISLADETIWTPVREWHAAGLGEEGPPRLFHWSLDGRYLYYTSTHDYHGACAVYDNIGDTFARLDLSDGQVAFLPPPQPRGILTFSADEMLMAYLSDQSLVVREVATAYDTSQDSVIWQIPLDVTWPTQVSEVIWSPDSQRVLVTADHWLEGNCDIAGHSSWELDVTTGVLTTTSAFVPTPEPTPIACATPEANGDITRESFLIFCGGRDHVNIPHTVPLTPHDALSVEAYVNYFGDGGEEPKIVIDSNFTFSLSFVQNRVSFCLSPWINNGYGDWVCLSHPQPEPGRWLHLAASWDGENMYLFYDGKLQAQSAFAGSLNHGPKDLILVIGNSWTTSAHTDEGFKGFIDEVRLSAIARYDADFEPQSQFTADEFTVGLWHFDEGHGTTTADESSYENNGYLSPLVKWGRP